jgi:small subunit ribosomal protein S2
LRDVAASGGKILFVATKKQAQDAIRAAAVACGQYHITERWLGGTLTNNQTIRRSIKRMRQIEAIANNNNGVLSIHKKEAANLRRELDKLQKNLSGIADMDRLPSALFVVDICRETNAIKEAARLGIPIVAIVDTNADPDPIDHVIPGNDDAIRGIMMIADAFARVIKEAYEQFSKVAAEKTRQAETERAAHDAQERGGAGRGKPRREPLHAGSDDAKEKLARTRRTAAKAAQVVVAAQAAAVEPAPAAPVAESPAPAAE